MARQRAEPDIILGPILYFRGEQGDRWWLSALFMLEGDVEPHDLRVDGVTLTVPPRHLSLWRGRHIWRFDFAVPRGVRDTEVTYGFANGESWTVTIPGRRALPRIAYVACNGAEDEAKFAKHGEPRYALWEQLGRRHEGDRYHLLLQGGDQLYADGVWRAPPLLSQWKKTSASNGYAGNFTAAMAEEAMDFYCDAYMKLLSQPEVARVISRIPSVMMWDDHDIFDGWGSHTEAEMHSQVWRGVYMAARRHFSLFQMGADPDSQPECVWGAPHGTFTQGMRFGDVGIFVPDLRSERTPTRVMSEKTWAMLPEWLDHFAECRHLLVMSSVPLLFPNTAGLERMVGLIPGRIGIEDDLRDQWRSHAHTEEWQRLIQLLCNFSRRSGCRVTALSGEIHVGARGVLRGEGIEMWQLISSGIVHPPHTAAMACGLEWLGSKSDQPLPGFRFEMPPFRESGKRIIRQRNWLSLIFDGKGQLQARWSAEGEPAQYLQVI